MKKVFATLMTVLLTLSTLSTSTLVFGKEISTPTSTGSSSDSDFPIWSSASDSGNFSGPLTDGYYVDNPEKVGSFGNYTLELGRRNLGVEIVEKRSPTARHYRNEDGSVTAILTGGPTSYEDEEGLWHDIDRETAMPTSPDSVTLSHDWHGDVVEVDNDALDPYLYNFFTIADGDRSLCVGQDLDPVLNDLYFRAFSQWDTGSIPAPSNVTDVDISFYVPSSIDSFIGDYVDIYECDMDVRQMSRRPSAWPRVAGEPIGRTLFDDAGDGTLYNYTWVAQGQGWTDVDLGSNADQDLEAQLSSSWFAVGFHEFTEHEDGTGVDRGVSFYYVDLSVTYTISPDPSAYDEYFYDIYYTPLDSDGDGYDDAVEVSMDVDTTYSGSLGVTVDAYLIDPYGTIIEWDFPFWYITGTESDWGYAYLYVPDGSPEGWFDVELYLYDEWYNSEDYQYEYDVAYLYPPDYPPPHDEYFYSVDYTSFDSDGDGYDDAVEVSMDVDTTYSGSLGVIVDAYLIDPYGSIVDSDFPSWTIAGTQVEYGYAYLYVPDGSPEGWYDVELWLFDEWINFEDELYIYDAAYLYPPVKDWTFMVYLDGDNNLEQSGIEIFLDMASVGSTSDVNIVVQMDRISGYDSTYDDWTSCKRFYVTPGLTPTSANAIEDLGEVNMGDPSTLSDFVNWAIDNYPANHYCLVLYDHGTGSVQMTLEGYTSTGVCFDDTDGDVLTLPELSAAFASVTSTMDVVFFDACDMGMLEVAYQIKDYADIMVGSEEIGWTPGPYDNYMTSLTGTPAISPSEFATAIVNHYIAWAPSPSTMSATDLSQIPSLATAASNFAQELISQEDTYHEEIDLARMNTEGYEGPYSGFYGYYIDLYHFAELVYSYVPNLTVQNLADQVMISLSNAIIAYGDNAHPNSHGLSIFFPDEDYKYFDFESVYLNTIFATATQWDEFVEYHLTFHPSWYDEYFFSVGYTSFDSDGDGYDDAVEVSMDVDTTYSGSLGVTVDAYLIDPYGSIVDSDFPSWTIAGTQVEYGYAYLYVPDGSPEGWFDVELYLYDEWYNSEDYQYEYDVAYLYPPDYPPPHDEYFMSADPVPFDSDGDGYDDAVEVAMDVDTTYIGSLGVTVNAYFIDPYGSYVDSDFLGWTIAGTQVEYGYAYLYVPAGDLEGWYDVELYLYDEWLNYEDYLYDYDVAYLYPPMHVVHLESLEDTGATSNFGTITFAGVTYSLPDDVSKPVGIYTAEYFADTGYMFDHWETSGGVSMVFTHVNPATVTVIGDGNLTAFYVEVQYGSFDFGTSSSPVESGYIAISESTVYSAFVGYGWDSVVGLGSRDRGAPDNLRRDLVYSGTDRTFNIDLQNGEHQVILVVGDNSYTHDLMDVYAEGIRKVNDLTVAAGTFSEMAFTVTVSDGQLNLEFHDDGGVDGNWVISAIVVRPPPPPTTTQFDFGTSSSPVESGYTAVSESTVYSAFVGYGWDSVVGLGSRDRGAPDDLRRDFVFSPTDHTFNVDLGNGDYQITIIIGDQNYAHDLIDVYAEGILKINDLPTAAGSFQQTTFYTTITDGQLNIRIHDDGGTDPCWIINTVTIEPGSPPPPPSEAWFDFGTSSSPVEAGYTQVTESTFYSASTGYGWSSTAGLDSRDRGAPDDLRRDFVFSGVDRIFSVDLDDGEYQVILVVGDQSYMHDLMDVYAEGVLKRNDLTVAAGDFSAVAFTVTVSDGQLNLLFHDDGGVDGNWVISAIVVRPPPPPTTTQFDFGTSSSPVESGYTAVSESTVYSAFVGYGWDSVVGLGSRDRGAPDDLRRDFVYSSIDRTFKVDLANGEYNVILVVGDNSYTHDLIDIYAEGILKRNDLTAAKGTFSGVLFTVTVSDGQLNLLFHDDGGTDGNWVINAIVIEPVS